MSKETFYFSHDYSTRSDVKIKKLISKHGMIGYGIYWAIIEDLYMNANALPLDCDGIAFDLRTKPQIIESIIKDFGLFVFEQENFGSMSVQKRIEERNKKSLSARESAFKRWEMNANALPSKCAPNAIKERKGKERKGKEKKGKEIKDASLIFPFESENFKKVWNVLTNEKKWANKSFASLQASLEQLSKYSEYEAIQMMKASIAGGWQGLFEIKKQSNGKENRSHEDLFKSAMEARDRRNAERGI